MKKAGLGLFMYFVNSGLNIQLVYVNHKFCNKKNLSLELFQCNNNRVFRCLLLVEIV